MEFYNYAYTPWSGIKNYLVLQKSWFRDIFIPFDESAVDHLEKLKCSAYKIASPEMNHIPLTKKLLKKNL